jgi:predicted RNase H-like HicB family nuclease
MDMQAKTTYDVLIQPVNGHFRATVIGLPDCSVEADSRADAVQRVRDALAKLLVNSEVIPVDMSVSTTSVRPQPALATMVGMWADNPLFDEFVAEVARYRAAVDSDPDRV